MSKFIKRIMLFFVFTIAVGSYSQKSCNFLLDDFGIPNIPFNISIVDLSRLLPVKSIKREFDRADLEYYELRKEVKFLNKMKPFKLLFVFKNNKLVFYRYEILNVTIQDFKRFREIIKDRNMFTYNKRYIFAHKETDCKFSISFVDDNIIFRKFLIDF